MASAPDQARKTLISSMIASLKRSGVWGKLDALWLYAAHSSQAATLNWKSSSFTCTPVNSPTFTADRGFQGDASTSYLDTGLDCSVGGINFSQNSGTMGIYVNSGATPSSAQIDIGVQQGTNGSLIRAYNTASNAAGRINASSTSNIGSTVTTALGDTCFTRTDSANVSAYRNGLSVGSVSLASVAPPSGNVYVAAFNNAGSASAFNARRYGAAYIGGGLTAQNVADLDAALTTYLNAVGGA